MRRWGLPIALLFVVAVGVFLFRYGSAPEPLTFFQPFVDIPDRPEDPPETLNIIGIHPTGMPVTVVLAPRPEGSGQEIFQRPIKVLRGITGQSIWHGIGPLNFDMTQIRTTSSWEGFRHERIALRGIGHKIGLVSLAEVPDAEAARQAAAHLATSARWRGMKRTVMIASQRVLAGPLPYRMVESRGTIVWMDDHGKETDSGMDFSSITLIDGLGVVEHLEPKEWVQWEYVESLLAIDGRLFLILHQGPGGGMNVTKIYDISGESPVAVFSDDSFSM